MRLTNEIRDRIITKIMSEKFSKQEEALKLEKFAFADELYNSIENVSKIVDLPEAWFVRACSFTARFNGKSAYQTMSLRRPIPYYIHNDGIRFTLEHEFTQRHIKMEQERHEFELVKKELKEELKKVLYAATTDKKLIEIWPEATKWLPSPATVYLPANVDVVKLRNLLKPL